MKWIKSQTDLNTYYYITDDGEIVGIVSREAKAVYRASVKGVPTYKTFKSIQGQSRQLYRGNHIHEYVTLYEIIQFIY